MSAFDILQRISENNNLLSADLRYCYVTKDKVPFNGTLPAKPNNPADFLSLQDLDISLAEKYEGLGISIQASNICAIDVDHCFANPFDQSSADSRAIEIMKKFSDITYGEFSFSGTGLRILFKANPIENYSSVYYIKNSKNQCEYYYPEGSNRYVTLTGRQLMPQPINFITDEQLKAFLDIYMLKPKLAVESKIFKPCEYKNPVLHFLRTDRTFQDNWFDAAPGSGANESERDFWLIKFIFDNISQEPEEIRSIFETSPYFKSKDRKHIWKWENNDHRYFKYLFGVIQGE